MRPAEPQAARWLKDRRLAMGGDDSIRPILRVASHLQYDDPNSLREFELP